MEIGLQKAVLPDAIHWNSWGLAFCGEQLDARGTAAVRELTTRAARVIVLQYEPEAVELKVDGDRVNADSFSEKLHSSLQGPVVLEATTLGFVEILLCCRALRKLGITNVDILYVEPERYRNPPNRHLLHRRDFELSTEVPGYRAIPGHAILLGDRTPQLGVFFVGYEEARLRRAFEDLQMIRPSKSAVTFGVPAFKPGWEMDAMANNIDVMREQNIRGGVYYCGAENPAAVIELLADVYQGLEPSERLFVAPIGTKPHGIGVALFVTENPNVGIIYDHPRRTKDRTEQVARWHLFSVQEFGIRSETTRYS